MMTRFYFSTKLKTLPVGSGASGSETLEVEISDPSTEVTVDGAGAVDPSSAVALSGTTTLDKAVLVDSVESINTTASTTLTVTMPTNIADDMIYVVIGATAASTNPSGVLTALLPTSGRARLGGYDVMTQAAQVRRVTSYCGSTLQAFYPRLTGAENLEFFAVLNDLPPRQAREQLRDILNLVGLADAAHTTFQCYSDGMKQRLALARALLTGSRIVLLDEPTKGLDPLMQVEMQRFFRRTLVERLGCTVLLVTHSVAEAEAVCDRVAILQRGVIVRVGKPREVSRWAAGGGHLSEVLPGAAAAAG